MYGLCILCNLAWVCRMQFFSHIDLSSIALLYVKYLPNFQSWQKMNWDDKIDECLHWQLTVVLRWKLRVFSLTLPGDFFYFSAIVLPLPAKRPMRKRNGFDFFLVFWISHSARLNLCKATVSKQIMHFNCVLIILCVYFFRTNCELYLAFCSVT